MCGSASRRRVLSPPPRRSRVVAHDPRRIPRFRQRRHRHRAQRWGGGNGTASIGPPNTRPRFPDQASSACDAWLAHSRGVPSRSGTVAPPSGFHRPATRLVLGASDVEPYASQGADWPAPYRRSGAAGVAGCPPGRPPPQWWTSPVDRGAVTPRADPDRPAPPSLCLSADPGVCSAGQGAAAQLLTMGGRLASPSGSSRLCISRSAGQHRDTADGGPFRCCVLRWRSDCRWTTRS